MTPSPDEIADAAALELQRIIEAEFPDFEVEVWHRRDSYADKLSFRVKDRRSGKSLEVRKRLSIDQMSSADRARAARTWIRDWLADKRA